MRSAKLLLSAGALCALASLVLTGCETGRANKLHSRYESVSDLTTVPHPNPEYASVADGIPPVPGSPTASGADGLQPNRDYEARKDPSTEKGIPMYPRMQPKDRFIRQ
ncbi:MAG: hypothetical protein WA294_21480 [Acidobacteriaceae bacterium]